MGFSIIYKPLFHIEVSHEFYGTGPAQGIYLRPTAATQKWLRSAKMVFRNTPNGILVFYREDENVAGSPKVNLGLDFTFLFSLHVAEKPKFLNITELGQGTSAGYKGGKQLYFENDTYPGLSLSYVPPPPLGGKRFSHQFALTGADKTHLNIKGPNVRFSPERPEANDNGDYLLTLDISTWPSGLYTFWEEDEGGGATSQDNFFLNNEKNDPSLMGFVAITYSSGGDAIYDTEEVYKIQFEARKVYWRYRIFNRTETAAGPLAIDSGGTPANFNGVDAPLPDPPAAVTEFISAGPIPFSQAPAGGIKLKGGGDEIIPHLPNPSQTGTIKANGSNFESEIYVYI